MVIIITIFAVLYALIGILGLSFLVILLGTVVVQTLKDLKKYDK